MKIIDCDWKSGKKYRRKNWKTKDYVYKVDGLEWFKDALDDSFIFKVEDVLANDWIEVICLTPELVQEAKEALGSIEFDYANNSRMINWEARINKIMKVLNLI